AAIIAETLAEAKDAAELVEVDYEALPSVTGTEDAGKPGAPAVWDEVPDNVCFLYRIGDKAASDAAFGRAHHVARERFVISRISPNSMEPRTALGAYDRREGRYTLHAGLQGVHGMRQELSGILKVPANRIRVISPDVGGAFGMKGSIYPELVLALWA